MTKSTYKIEIKTISFYRFNVPKSQVFIVVLKFETDPETVQRLQTTLEVVDGFIVAFGLRLTTSGVDRLDHGQRLCGHIGKDLP